MPFARSLKLKISDYSFIIFTAKKGLCLKFNKSDIFGCSNIFFYIIYQAKEGNRFFSS